MVKLDILKIDAFASQVFSGNPAAVVGLSAWLPDRVLQAIAEENNLSETAYYVRKSEDRFDLRWFTPSVEVDLCGHATLATAFAIFAFQPDSNRLHFDTRSGELVVTRTAEGLAMDFPCRMPTRIAPPEGLLAALGLDAGEVWEADDYIVLVETEDHVETLSPDFQALAAFPKRGIAVTAKGRDFDFVSRWFGPRVGVNEDPVTGSAHTWLAPLWAERLGKSSLTARQGGQRKGNLTCEMAGDRVILTGRAVTFLRGVIDIGG